MYGGGRDKITYFFCQWPVWGWGISGWVVGEGDHTFPGAGGHTSQEGTKYRDGLRGLEGSGGDKNRWEPIHIHLGSA